MIAKMIKDIITFLKVKCNRIDYRGGYIGFDVKIVNRGKIVLYKGVIIRPSSHVYAGNNRSVIEFGEGTEIGNHSTISAHNAILFGKDVLTGPHVFVSDHNHEYTNPNMAISKQGVKCDKGGKVTIGDGTWIGTNAVIVGNVNIGKHCVIGANSVVTKDIPDYCVAAGIPAKIIKKYNFDSSVWERF